MAAAEYIAAVLQDTPIAFWKMQDASGNPVDSSGNGFDMTSVTGTPDYQQAGPMSDFGIHFGAGEFTTRSTHVSTATDNFTMEVWVYPISIGADGRTLFNNGTSNATQSFGIAVNTTALFVYVAGTVVGNTSAVSLPLSTWSHVAVKRSSNWTYYYNGAIDTANATLTAPVSVTGTVQIAAGNNFDLRVAYVAVYETALSDARILAHYQAGVGVTTPADDPPMGFSGRGAGW